MASIILGKIGSQLGGTFGAIGASIGSKAGRYAGNILDDLLQGKDFHRHKYREGPRLEDLEVQTSTYGRMIPITYGIVRLKGNIIWSLPIEEHVFTTSTTTGGGKFGLTPKLTSSFTDYSYTVTLAIALCEGEIETITRVWANNKPVDLSKGTYRLYHGTEDQLPDPLIEAHQGVGSTPAYRGLAYVVIEDLPLEPFANNIPQFTFEVKRGNQQIRDNTNNDNSVESLITGVTLIPGSGEFVYDTSICTKALGDQTDTGFIPQGKAETINQHHYLGTSDVVLALDQLQATLPNLEWIAPVVSWFGDSLDIATCQVLPSVEFKDNIKTTPEDWQVSSYDRQTARLMLRDEQDRPQYGGTPHDGSVIRLLEECKQRGLNVMFYPMLFMDVVGKPWRGRLGGDHHQVASFFTKPGGYNQFILHYANLVKGLVDAFVIGSEFKMLTSITDETESAINRFPAVKELVNVAEQVKAILGNDVKVTYAADWSEYHSTHGWFNLDYLWASDAIDIVGIDAYFPLVEGAQDTSYSIEPIMQAWESGEGYDYYYQNSQTREGKVEYNGYDYAWKNIRHWWEHTHTQPDGSISPWQPSSKPIWFTEYGFPSIDAAASQPNRFIDATSDENAIPLGSAKQVDVLAQRSAIEATERYWQDSDMVVQTFLWTWDARPYPYYPDLQLVWADGANWETGHFVQGKLGLMQLGQVVYDLLRRAGLANDQIDVLQLNGIIMGYVLTRPLSIADTLIHLQRAYFFDLVEDRKMVRAIPRAVNQINAEISADECLVNKQNQPLSVSEYVLEDTLPSRLIMSYIDSSRDYQIANVEAYAALIDEDEHDRDYVSLPLILTPSQAKQIAEINLHEIIYQQHTQLLTVPFAKISARVGDRVLYEGQTFSVTKTSILPGHISYVLRTAEPLLYLGASLNSVQASVTNEQVGSLADTSLVILDLPQLPQFGEAASLLVAMAPTAEEWQGASLYSSYDRGNSYQLQSIHKQAATMGKTVSVLGAGPYTIWDEVSEVTINLLHGELYHADKMAVLNGANLISIGGELLQFSTATRLGDYQYRLSGFLRGRYGTEYQIDQHQIGEDVVLINNALLPINLPHDLLGQSLMFKAVTLGNGFNGGTTITQNYGGNMYRCYAPVHLTHQQLEDGSIVISWIRRTRMAGSWRDGVDVLLGEEQERYQIEIIIDGEYKRTEIVSDPSYYYLSEQQTTDSCEVGSNIQCIVSQYSFIYGNGYINAVNFIKE